MLRDIVIPKMFRVTCHTDHVGPGSTFIAIQGRTQDGASYIPIAIERGATKIVVAHDAQLSPSIKKAIEQANVGVDYVEDTRKELAMRSAQAYDYPARKLVIIGITGTKGKTTTSYLLAHILQKSGHKTALMSTVANRIGDTLFSTHLTTQQPDYIHAFLHTCVQHEITHVVMEVAAQAVSLHRTAGIEFDGLIFTNFEPEHAEFYPTVDDYFAAKCALFAQAAPDAPCLVNADDAGGQKLLACRGAQKTGRIGKMYTFGLQNTAYDIRALIHEHATTRDCMFDLVWQGNKQQVTCPLFAGDFNLYNGMAALGMAVLLGIPLCMAGQALRSCCSIPGRLEEHRLANGARCFIDYAHTPSSYQQVLSALRAHTDHLLVVFGAGGERDQGKRPIMGGIAARLADVVFITSDNPRSEDPRTIAEQIIAGVRPCDRHKVVCELDREKAIKQACAQTTPQSIIVLLGKGPDEYQQIGSIKHSFSEKNIIKHL